MKPQETNIPCVILCGGKSSRMKEDKSLLSFNGYSSLSKYQYIRLSQYFSNVYLSCKNNKFDFEAKLLLEENDIFSPIVALENCISKLNNYDKIFIITVDTPLVKIESIKKLIENSKDCDICVAQTEKVHNLCGVFSTKILPTLRDMLSKDFHKVGYLLNNYNTKKITFSSDDEFINLNKPDDYKKALEIIS